MSIEEEAGMSPESEDQVPEIKTLIAEIDQIRRFMDGKLKNDNLSVGAFDLLREINADDNKFHQEYDNQKSLTKEKAQEIIELLEKIRDGLMDFVRMNSPELYQQLKNELPTKE
jgi:hypothetical protein